MKNGKGWATVLLCLILSIVFCKVSAKGDISKEKEGYTKAGEILAEVNRIVFELEKIYHCRKVDAPKERLGNKPAKRIIRDIKSPVILREVLYYSEYRYQRWLRVNPDISLGQADFEGELSLALDHEIPAQLAHLKTDESMKVLVEILDDMGCDGEFGYHIGGAITSCGKDILPHLKEYISYKRQFSSRVRFAKRLIGYIEKGKIFGP